MAKHKKQDVILVEYDSESDSLAICRAHKKSSFSLEIGDIIVDFDRNKEVVGIEFINATTLLSALAKQTLTKNILQQITQSSFQTKHAGNNLIITFTLILPKTKIEEKITIPFLEQKKIEVVV